MKSSIRKLSITVTLCVAISLVSCMDTSYAPQGTSDTDTDACAPPVLADKSEDYIGSFIFFGESTTYHMKSRGVLSGGKDTTQIWAPKSGTVNLDATTKSIKIVFPDTNEEISLSEAASRTCPARIMLTFGLNGATYKIKKGEEYFRTCYKLLISTIRESSPSTKIYLQSCFPISESMDMSAYTVDAQALNAYIDVINTWTARLAADEGLYYVNSASCLKDSRGFLMREYDSGDGYHLTAAAYQKILEYINLNRPTEDSQ